MIGEEFADVVGGDVQIDVGGEFGADAAVVFLARGLDPLDAGHAGYRALKDADHLGVHGFRRGAVEERAHGDDGAVDVGQFADLDAHDRGQTGDHDQQVHDDDQRGPADRQGRQIAEPGHVTGSPFSCP